MNMLSFSLLLLLLVSNTLAQGWQSLGSSTVRCSSPLSCQNATLTPPLSAQLGAVWTSSSHKLGDGFTFSFDFRVTNQSRTCPSNVLSAQCQGRGGEGFALLLSGLSSATMGSGGSGLGYDSLSDTIAIEFDTYFSPDLEDESDNHIGVQIPTTRLPSATSSRSYPAWTSTPAQFQSTARVISHHASSLATSSSTTSSSSKSVVSLPNLADGAKHSVRIQYLPTFDDRILHPSLCLELGACDRFQLRTEFASLLASNIIPRHQVSTADDLLPVPDRYPGLGTLWIWVDDLVTPVLITLLPIELISTPNAAKFAFSVRHTAAALLRIL